MQFSVMIVRDFMLHLLSRLSVYNWIAGPRRGKEDAIEKQIAGKWHIITFMNDLT